MGEASPPDLREQFSSRLLGGLVANTVLRGAWAEEIVGHYLGSAEFADQWSYFDLAWRGAYLSVKHSTGPKARFAVRRSSDAWRPHPSEPGSGEWMAGGGEPRYWCDLYVFAHLPGEVSLERILDVEQWQFAVLSRGAMEREFEPTTSSCSRSRLEGIARFVAGGALAAEAGQALVGS